MGGVTCALTQILKTDHMTSQRTRGSAEPPRAICTHWLFRSGKQRGFTKLISCFLLVTECSAPVWYTKYLPQLKTSNVVSGRRRKIFKCECDPQSGFTLCPPPQGWGENLHVETASGTDLRDSRKPTSSVPPSVKDINSFCFPVVARGKPLRQI